MSTEVQTQTGRCAIHGTVQATREIPGWGFPFIVYAILRSRAKHKPFLCPECGAAIEPGGLSIQGCFRPDHAEPDGS